MISKIDWSNILEECNSIFEKDPIIELAFSETFNKYRSSKIKKIKPKHVNFLIKHCYSYYLIYKSLMKNNCKIGNNFLKTSKSKKFGVFSILRKRDETGFFNIFPILKEIDKSLDTILFTRKEIYDKHIRELDSLRKCKIIIIDYINADLSIQEIIRSYEEANRLYKKIKKNVKNKNIKKFFLKYKIDIFNNIRKIIVDSSIIDKLIPCSNILFFFSTKNTVFAVLGKKYNIRTLMFQHGFHGNTVKNPVQYSPGFSDEIIVWGEDTKKHIRPICGADHKVYALGSPRHDKIVKDYVNKPRKKEFYKNLNIDYKKMTVVFFSQTHAIDRGYPRERYIKPIFALDKLYNIYKDDINLVIKLHPAETKKYYREYMENIKNVKIIKNEISLYELLSHTDISLSVGSTTTLESMIFRIPVLQLGLSEHGVSGEDMYKSGATLLIEDNNQLIQMMREIIDGNFDMNKYLKEQRVYLERNYANLGNAADEIIKHLIKRNNLDSMN